MIFTRTFGVAILLLLMEGSSLAQLPQPFTDDSRFAQKQTIKVRCERLQDLMNILSKQTGIKFDVTRDLNEDKVILYAYDRPLGETLDVLARYFKFQWRREGKPGEYSYTLYQDVRSKQEEEGYWEP